MTRQQLLDIDNPTPQEWATQQLVVHLSKTRLEAVRRIFKEIDERMYKTFAKQLTLQEIYQSIDYATKFANDQEVEELD